MKWILMVWMTSSDPGFPGAAPALERQAFETQAQCVQFGEESLVTPRKDMWTVVAYTCSAGNVTPMSEG